VVYWTIWLPHAVSILKVLNLLDWIVQCLPPPNTIVVLLIS
jgi:hypothetical protein